MRRAGAGLLCLPAVLYVSVLFAAPLVALLPESVRDGAGWGVGPYLRFFASGYNWGVVERTVRLAAESTLICAALGYPAAFALARVRGRWQPALVGLLLLPLTVSVIVKAFGWTVLLRSNGAVNLLLQGVGLTDGPVRLLFTETGLLLGISNIFLPFMVLPVFASVRQLDPSLGDAAATLGSAPVHRFLRVTLPLTAPGLLAGVTLVFSLSLAAYVIPTLLMGDRFQTLPTVIATSFLYLQDPGRGAVAAVTLLVLAVAAITGSSLLAARLRTS